MNFYAHPSMSRLIFKHMSLHKVSQQGFLR